MKSNYEILGIPEMSPISVIKKAYKAKVLTMHPDKGGNEEAFKELVKAYNELINVPVLKEIDLPLEEKHSLKNIYIEVICTLAELHNGEKFPITYVREYYKDGKLKRKDSCVKRVPITSSLMNAHNQIILKGYGNYNDNEVSDLVLKIKLPYNIRIDPSTLDVYCFVKRRGEVNFDIETIDGLTRFHIPLEQDSIRVQKKGLTFKTRQGLTQSDFVIKVYK